MDRAELAGQLREYEIAKKVIDPATPRDVGCLGDLDTIPDDVIIYSQLYEWYEHEELNDIIEFIIIKSSDMEEYLTTLGKLEPIIQEMARLDAGRDDAFFRHLISSANAPN
jgi:hypothetical protein